MLKRKQIRNRIYKLAYNPTANHRVEAAMSIEIGIHFPLEGFLNEQISTANT